MMTDLQKHWPLWLVHWYKQMSESLPVSDFPEFRRSILTAVPVGVGEEETERWRHAIAVRRLNRLRRLQQPDCVDSALAQVVEYHADAARTEEMRLAAESAAYEAREAARAESVWSPAFCAASSAWLSAKTDAESAAESANLAARAAAAATWAAREAARAEYRAQWRDFLDVAASKMEI